MEQFKYVNVSESVSIPVPKGLSPEEEANYIAGRIAFVNLEQLEMEVREAWRLHEEGKLLPFDKLVTDLQREYGVDEGDADERG